MLNFLTVKKERKSSSLFIFDEIKTIVGVGDFFKGDLVSNNFIRLDGDFMGTISSTKRVIIGESGRVKSSIDANELVISGMVVGNIYAKSKIKIFASGCVIGNISCKSIEVEEGAIIDGYMDIGSEHLRAPERNTFFYTGSYKVDEDLLIEINKEYQEEKKSFQPLEGEDDKYFTSVMSKIDESK
ncbi:bactofilin family protein [Borreliella bavariensis]|uniref:bactofilin family protein n=1 Tax=Borreliella bavariensis TaxID=664662 RepID=UPI001C003253|nr:polymer-forming cytoskeletal protein [Borreliella bavariensis]